MEHVPGATMPELVIWRLLWTWWQPPCWQGVEKEEIFQCNWLLLLHMRHPALNLVHQLPAARTSSMLCSLPAEIHLICRCDVMWSEGWNAEGMQAVPLAQLREIMPSDSQAAGSLQDGTLIKQMAAVHESRLFCSAAPRQYVAFVAMFRKVFAHKQEQLLEQQSFLKVLPGTSKATVIRYCLLASGLPLRDTSALVWTAQSAADRLDTFCAGWTQLILVGRRNSRLPWQFSPLLAVIAVHS